jgi:hypothetical protein
MTTIPPGLTLADLSMSTDPARNLAACERATTAASLCEAVVPLAKYHRWYHDGHTATERGGDANVYGRSALGAGGRAAPLTAGLMA